MLCEIGKIVKLYKEHPEYIGKVFVDTPYGKKRILYADIVEKNTEVYKLKTDIYELIGSPQHRVECNNKWMYLKDISNGDFVSTINGKKKVLLCQKENDLYDLYDIQVEDVEQYYSNGILSHNSSFLETIPFALFGKVHKDIKKDQIVNWKNRKGCEVHLTFTKGESEYRVYRGIKPDKF